MAEYLLFRMAVIGALTGMFALAIMVGQITPAAWRHFYQRKEFRL